MIVKDEAETLEENLRAARPHVDEVVIVDTGSSDGTVEIAKKYADKFKQIEWPDSFSKARNVSLDMASGDYVVYLDGDEAIKDPQHWENIREAIVQNKPDGLAIQIENELPENQILSGDKVWELRIFRLHPKIRFRGRVHNQISPAIQENPIGDKAEFMRVEAVSHHIGYSYSPEELEEKYRQRIPLLEAEIKDAEEANWEHYYRYQLGNGLFMLKDYERALEELERVDMDELTEENEFSALLMLVHCYMSFGEPDNAREASMRMIDLWGQEAISYLMFGLSELRSQRYNAAFSAILMAMHLADLRNDLRYDVDVHYVAAAAGEAALQLKKLGRAKRLFRFHLEKYPENDQVRSVEQKIVQRGQEPGNTPIRPPLRTH